MNWEKEYIIQTYENAANNLRLNSTRLINHTLIKEFLVDCQKIERAISEMKKVTEFAKFAIKLGRVLEYTQSIPDFIRLSSDMTKQINDLIPIIREMLDTVNPEELSERLNWIKNNEEQYEVKESETESKNKSEIVLEVVGLIRKVDEYLNVCAKEEISSDEKENFIEIVNKLDSLLVNFDDGLIVEMKNIFIRIFKDIITRRISNSQEIDAMRACLIVIVAKLKKKDVDVTQFIKLARTVALEKEDK